MEEIWRDGIYIDENGNVLILNGIQVSNTEKLCKNGKTFDYSNFNGASPYITFRYYGKTLKFHRLVLSTFNPVSDTYAAINHKDFNKHHNTPSNLEWCTYDYNNRYSNLYAFLDNTGKKMSEETKKKISESLKGRRQTDETREKLRNKLKGRHLSESAKEKLSNYHKGKHLSEETKKKISESLIRHYAS